MTLPTRIPTIASVKTKAVLTHQPPITMTTISKSTSITKEKLMIVLTKSVQQHQLVILQ